MPPIATARELQLIAPDKITFGEERIRCGDILYRGLKHLLAREGEASVKSFATAVWGEEKPNGTVRQTLWRLNRILEGLGCERRATLDGDVIRFV